VRYLLESILLWEPDRRDHVGRQFILRYFSYRDGNEAHCSIILLGFFVSAQAIRFVIFALQQATDFSAAHDMPLFLLFLVRILAVNAVLFLVIVVVHEMPRLRGAWRESLAGAVEEARGGASAA